jgi:formate dehydrogenase
MFLEGALMASIAVSAEKCFIYIRDEYPAILYILKKEIIKLEQEKIIPVGFFDLRRGAGAYICGEESAMIESIEGKRGLPRHRPPYIAEKGLFGKPTLNHNIETLFWIPDILSKGADWFANLGYNSNHKGLRSYSVSGRVLSPGVKVAPPGKNAFNL